MESYRILLFLHIVAVVLAVGAGYTFPFLQAFAERSGVGATKFYLRFARRLQNILIIPALVLVAVFGVGLMFDDNTGYMDDMPAWLTISIAWYVVVTVVGLFLVRRADADALALLEAVPDNGSFPPAYLALSRRSQAIGGILGLSFVAIAFLMVWGAEGGF